jgi:hypothetical protein
MYLQNKENVPGRIKKCTRRIRELYQQNKLMYQQNKENLPLEYGKCTFRIRLMYQQNKENVPAE